MLTQEQVTRFAAEGFVRGGRVLSAAQVALLQDEIARVLHDAERSTPGLQPVRVANLGDDPAQPVWQIVNIWQASAPFRDLIQHPLITEEVAQLTGATQLRLWHDQIQYKPAGRGGVNHWHQDAPFWPILTPMTQVTAWVALDDVDESNGCMCMVPGSQHWADHHDFLATVHDIAALPSAYEGHAVTIRPCPVPVGAVHYHHALVWHGSLANTSGRPRRAIALHYMTQETRYVAGGEHIMKPFVTVADGAALHGEHFPLVWERASSVAAVGQGD